MILKTDLENEYYVRVIFFYSIRMKWYNKKVCIGVV